MIIGWKAAAGAARLAACLALTGLALAAVPARGEGRACGGIGGLPCGKGMFCNEPIGTCGRGDRGGTCMRRPEICPKIYMPVCGCNGKTYGNNCEREAAGVSELHAGHCK